MQQTGLKRPSLGSQLEDQISVCSPVPILLIKPWARTSLPSKIDLQVRDGFLPTTACKNSPSAKYTALRIRKLTELSGPVGSAMLGVLEVLD